MTNLIKAELLAARGTRSVWALAAVAVAVAASVAWAVLDVVVFMKPGDRIDSAYSMASQGYLFAMVLGIMLAAGEYRHHTITWTLLITPHRARAITANLIACAIIGVVVGIAATVVTAPLTAGSLGSTHHPVLDACVPFALVGSVASTGLWTVFGAGLGFLVRHQASAIAAAFVWFYYVEWTLVALVPAVGRWTPTGGSEALAGWNRTGLPVAGTLLPAWAGGLLLAGYAVTAALAALATSTRRDLS